MTKELKLKVLKEARKIVADNLYSSLTVGICASVKMACRHNDLEESDAKEILRELHSKHVPNRNFVGWWFPTDTIGRADRARLLDKEIEILELQISADKLSDIMSDETKLRVLKDLRTKIFVGTNYGMCHYLEKADFQVRHGVTFDQIKSLIKSLRNKYAPDKSTFEKWFSFDAYGQSQRLELIDKEISLLEKKYMLYDSSSSAKASEYMYMGANRSSLGIPSPSKEKPKRVKQLMLVEYDKLDHLTPITEKTFENAIFLERNAKVTEIKIFDKD